MSFVVEGIQIVFNRTRGCPNVKKGAKYDRCAKIKGVGSGEFLRCTKIKGAEIKRTQILMGIRLLLTYFKVIMKVVQRVKNVRNR